MNRHSTARAPTSDSPRAGARERALGGLPVEERRLQIGPTATAILEGGAGIPIVLLHGPGEHAPKWTRVIPGLVRTHRVIAPDLPGHGASEVSGAPLDADAVLEWLDTLIARTCSEPPVLVGQILGGAIAARFATAHGARIRRLVLADSLGLVPFAPAPEFGKALTAFLMRADGASHDELWSFCAFDLKRLRSTMGDAWERLRAYNLDRAGVPGLQPQQHRLMEQFGLPAMAHEELSRITVPTALIWGRQDLATPLRVAEAASERYGWPLHIIDRCGDDPPMERPEAFLEALYACTSSKE